MRLFSTTRLLRFLGAAPLIFVVGCLNSDDESASDIGIEYKLATIQQGGYVSKDDPLLVRFAQALDRLETKCPEPRERLADMGVKGRDLLRERGIQEPLVSILRTGEHQYQTR
jgi:hypothetical protein